MESLTNYLNRLKTKHNKTYQRRDPQKRNGPVKILAQSISKESVKRKRLRIPKGTFKVFLEDTEEVKELPDKERRRAFKRLLPKSYDQEMIYRLYGE